MNIKKITFSEVCRIMNSKEENIKKCAMEVFKFALALPDLICPECSAVIGKFTNFPVSDAISVGEIILKTFKRTNDYYTTYENAQIAQVLIVFSAYFDTIKRYMPDENNKIDLSLGETITLTEEAKAKYLKDINRKFEEKWAGYQSDVFSYDLSLPDSFEDDLIYSERLLEFYKRLNDQFINFFRGLRVYENYSEVEYDRLRPKLEMIPKMAVEAYYQQHVKLASEFPDYFKFTVLEEQRHTRDTVIRARKHIEDTIDVGFQEHFRLLQEIPERLRESRANDIVDFYAKRHKRFLKKPILDRQNSEYEIAEGIILPTNEDLFIPQSFRALRFQNGSKLESNLEWDKLNDQDNIAEFISHTIHHSDTGSKPLIILGHPGAGKTLLSQMLASQVLCQEYHVIIIRLRDVNAEDEIHMQITKQIQNDNSGFECSWNDIVRGNLAKPIVLIFDGYDELLQASGKTYADYIARIAKFQQEQMEDYNIFIRCIITSRTTLIDRARIPIGCPIIRLADFDDKRIEKWCSIWNLNNWLFFKTNKIEEFHIEPHSNAYELSKQPLLLVLLALFDADDNNLRKYQNLTRVQLYNHIIRNFIKREKWKDKKIRRSTHTDPFNQAFYEISIAAVGMFNRARTYIRADELQKDLSFFLDLNVTQEDSNKLFGSFFFIHTSKATELRVIHGKEVKEEHKLYAYEFLHNTFGEFLTASYIASQVSDSDINYCPSEKIYICLASAPLFSRPVIIDMFKELICSSLQTKEQAINVLDTLLNQVLHGIISGEFLLDFLQKILDKREHLLKIEPMFNIAIYTINLLLLRISLGEYIVTLEEFDGKDIWKRLLNIWKYAFEDDDLTRIANLLCAEKLFQSYCIKRQYELNFEVQESHLSQLHFISYALQDNMTFALTSALVGDTYTAEMTSFFDKSKLNIESQFWWNYFSAFQMLNNEQFTLIISILNKLQNACLRESNIGYLYSCYSVVIHMIMNSNIHLLSDEDSRSAASMLYEFTSHELFYSNTVTGKCIREISLSVVDYLNLDDIVTYSTVLSLFTDIQVYKLLVNGNDLIPMWRSIKFYNYLLQKKNILIKKNEVEKLDGLISVYFKNAELFRREFHYLNKIIDREILIYSDNLISTDMYRHYADKLLNDFNQYILSYYLYGGKNWDIDEVSIVLFYLQSFQRLIPQNIGPSKNVVLRVVMSNVSISELYLHSPESIIHFCILLEHDPDLFEERNGELVILVREHGSSFSLNLYKHLLHLAEQSPGGIPLLSALDELIKSNLF